MFGRSHERTSNHRIGPPTRGQAPSLGAGVARLVAGSARWGLALAYFGRCLSFASAAGLGADSRPFRSLSVHAGGVDPRWLAQNQVGPSGPVGGRTAAFAGTP